MNHSYPVTPAQALVLVAAMSAISHADGVHPAETELIQQFYEGSREDGMPSFAEVQSTHGEVDRLIRILPVDAEFGKVLVTSCLMVGYADGTLSENELSVSRSIASAYGIGEEQFDQALQDVRDALLGSLASLPDAASVAALAKEL